MEAEVPMPVWLIQSPIWIVLSAILLTAVVSVVTRAIILPHLGIEWPFRRVKVPWRFSLFSILVLVALTALVLGLLHDSSDLAFVILTILLVIWLTVVRYFAFRRDLADRSKRALATMLPRPKGNQGGGD